MKTANVAALVASTLATLLPVVAQANTPPVVDAGTDVTIFPGELAVLNASATDADGDPILQWMWSVVSQPAMGFGSFLPGPFVQQPLFIGSVMGDYLLEVSACDAGGCGAADMVVVSVVGDLPPLAKATADVVSGPAPLTVTFDGSGSSDPEGSLLQFHWVFGDLSPASSVVSPLHVYMAPGDYTAFLTVTDGSGNMSEDTLLVTVLTSPANAPPTSSPTASPVSGAAPLAVSFAANGADDDGDVLSYLWDFGDPNSPDNASTEAAPSHVYAAAGGYVAWLTVSDGIDSATYSLAIAVDSPGYLSVESARIKWKKHDHTRADMALHADVTPGEPAPEDVVTVLLDGTPLFAAPFSAFRLTDDDSDGNVGDDDDDAGRYLLKARHVRVRLDTATGRLAVAVRGADLSGLDPTNGVDVELYVGDMVAIENIPMVSCGRHLRYRRAHDDAAEGSAE